MPDGDRGLTDDKAAADRASYYIVLYRASGDTPRIIGDTPLSVTTLGPLPHDTAVILSRFEDAAHSFIDLWSALQDQAPPENS